MLRLLLVLSLFCPALLHAQEARQAIPQVLALTPLPLPAKALDKGDKAADLRRVLVSGLSARLPAAGENLSAFGRSSRWQAFDPAQATAEEALWSLNIEADGYAEATLELSGLAQPHLYLDGVAQTLKDGAATLKLSVGSHRLLLLHGGREAGKPLAFGWREAVPGVSTHLRPSRLVSTEQLLDAETVNALALSPDGRLALIGYNRRDTLAGVDVARMELREVAANRVLRHWTGNVPVAPAFSPDGRWLGYREGRNFWVEDLRDGGARALLTQHEHLGSWQWHPDSRSILFAWVQPFDAKDAKVKRLRGLEDRWKTFRDIAQIHQLDLASGLVRPLTDNPGGASLLDVHPDGDRLLYTERLSDYAEPPHSLFRIVERRLDDGSERELGRHRNSASWRYAEDGFWVLSGPGFMEGAGREVADLDANEYDGQLYFVDASGKQVTHLSAGFAPSLGEMQRLADGDLVLSAVEADRVTLYRFDARRRSLHRLATGLDVVEGFTVAPGSSTSVLLRGTLVDAPQRLVALDARRGAARVLWDSQPTEYPQVRLGEVRDWTFDNRDGQSIDGRYYLPPDFDPARQYPLIVYYYGGTTPVNRQFTGRYPFHLWAARGYVIYVLQPRGTIGYGQAFSALHVNAWGKYSAEDILDGTDAFVAAHPFVDGRRVGNIGASYGGFMTMYLATLTDRFTASISHAGISNLSSYWGEGWWGYGYSGIASRGSFPWNNPELYVGQSPVYRADKITTPLLLITGDADVNVPRGESHTMYTALKLLGREVELVEVPGEDHHILQREKRLVWSDTLLAWFDRWLKAQPQAWEALYPETRQAAERD